jgi:hypothetical protein
MAEKKKLSPAQRAALFAQMTRQNFQMLPAVAGSEGATISIDIPRTKLLAKIYLLVEATLNGVHAASTDMTLAPFAPYTLIRSARVKMNNGFSPFQISGKGLYMYNLANLHSDQIPVVTGAANTGSSRSRTVCGVATDASGDGGADNTVRFLAELPLMLNDRDPIGLILAQNAETLINVEIDLGQVTDLVPTAAGFTTTLSNITVTPMTTTFTVPSDLNALPDLSVLKLVHEFEQSIAGSGQQMVKLQVGNTYRKLFIWIEDAAGAGVADAAITGNFELLFNQADIPYAISPKVLAGINQQVYGKVLPQGLWVFDWSYNGFAGYGGSRDLIDTERLSEFWFRFNAAGAGRVKVISETLSQMR